jgi:hypothetical protein
MADVVFEIIQENENCSQALAAAEARGRVKGMEEAAKITEAELVGAFAVVGEEIAAAIRAAKEGG